MEIPNSDKSFILNGIYFKVIHYYEVHDLNSDVPYYFVLKGINYAEYVKMKAACIIIPHIRKTMNLDENEPIDIEVLNPNTLLGKNKPAKDVDFYEKFIDSDLLRIILSYKLGMVISTYNFMVMQNQEKGYEEYYIEAYGSRKLMDFAMISAGEERLVRHEDFSNWRRICHYYSTTILAKVTTSGFDDKFTLTSIRRVHSKKDADEIIMDRAFEIELPNTHFVVITPVIQVYGDKESTFRWSDPLHKMHPQHNFATIDFVITFRGKHDVMDNTIYHTILTMMKQYIPSMCKRTDKDGFIRTNWNTLKSDPILISKRVANGVDPECPEVDHTVTVSAGFICTNSKFGNTTFNYPGKYYDHLMTYGQGNSRFSMEDSIIMDRLAEVNFCHNNTEVILHHPVITKDDRDTLSTLSSDPVYPFMFDMDAEYVYTTKPETCKVKNPRILKKARMMSFLYNMPIYRVEKHDSGPNNISYIAFANSDSALVDFVKHYDSKYSFYPLVDSITMSTWWVVGFFQQASKLSKNDLEVLTKRLLIANPSGVPILLVDRAMKHPINEHGIIEEGLPWNWHSLLDVSSSEQP